MNGRRPTLAFYISGHGFGHASRDIEVLNALHRLAPEVRLIVRTSAPRWLFDLTLDAPIEWHPAECDTGIVQVDSLRLDIDETLRRAAAFHANLAERAADEATFLTDVGADLVVGDIPPLAFAAARAARLPSLAIGNFTWDWIYDGYPEARRDYPALVPALAEAYTAAGVTLRLPLGGGFSSTPCVERVPFIARRSTHARAETRAHFGLADGDRLVLASFGGYGLKDIDLSRLAQLDGWKVVVTSSVRARRRDPDRGTAPMVQPGEGAAGADPGLPPTVIYLDERRVYADGFRYEDIVAAVDVVATKPGYGIIAECVANGAAMVYTSRGRFAEYDVMVEEMPRYLRCAFLSNEALYAGEWQQALDAVVAQPEPPERPATNGAEVVAGRIAALLTRNAERGVRN